MKTQLCIHNLPHLLAAGIALAACISLGVAASESRAPANSSTQQQLPTGAPTRVGALGDPARLSIEGLQTFTEGTVRRALRGDLDYLVGAHPEAPLEDCLAAVEDRLQAGYHNSGFRGVVVQGRFDVSAGRIIVKVIEGPRFRCGPLRVIGLKSIPVTDFARRFAETLASVSTPTTASPVLWKTGVFVSFTPASLTSYSAAASNTFAALGRFGATFKVEIQPQPGSSDAALAVIVADEGPAAVLRDIEVVGNQKNPPDALIDFLGFTKGMKITQDIIDEKARTLTQSARFTDSSITRTVLGSGGQVSLRIKVVENSHLPALQQPLSREEKTMLRMREWLMAWESRQEDLVLSWSPPTARRNGPQRIEVIVAPTGGITARVMGNSNGQEKLPDLYSIVIRTDTLAMFAQLHERKLRVPFPTGYSGLFFAKLAPCTDCPSGFSLSLGAGLSPAQTKGGWQVRLDLLPAALTARLYQPGTKATWQGNVLTVRTEDWMMRVDEGTGRLLEIGSMIDKSASRGGAPSPYRVGLRFIGGAFAKAVDHIAASTSTHVDAFQSRRALGSALGFITAELSMSKPLWSSAPGNSPAEPQAALSSGLEKLLASSFLDPLQALLEGAEASRGDDEFTIPTRPMETPNQDSVRLMFENVAVWCAGHAQELAPADSWLQTLLREAAFTLASRTQYTPAALARLAEDLGPLGCYVAVHALHWSNQGSLAVPPEQVLRRLNTEDFRRDYRILLNPESVLTRCLGNLVRELGTLTKPEVEAIAGLLPPDSASLVRDLAAAARQGKDLPLTEVLGPVLDRWWETRARARVEADFRSHVKRQRAPR